MNNIVQRFCKEVENVKKFTYFSRFPFRAISSHFCVNQSCREESQGGSHAESEKFISLEGKIENGNNFKIFQHHWTQCKVFLKDTYKYSSAKRNKFNIMYFR